MIRILHTADWQIGLRASHVARVGDAVRKARLDSARTVVEQANEAKADALVLAGDIFEDNHVDNTLVYEIARILGQAQVPVFVLPGNHDPLSQDSVYKRASWRERSANIRLLETTDPVMIAGGAALLLPAPLSLKKSIEDPTDALRLPEVSHGGTLIGVAHGSLKIEGKYGKDDFPIALDAATKKGLSYLALGHWHGRYVHGERIAYSGTQETTKFGEDNSGMALMVEFASPGLAPHLRELRTGKLIWLAREINLSHGAVGEVQRLKQELAAFTHPKDSVLLRLRTTGESGPEAHLLLKALEEELASKFLYFEIDRRDLPSSVVEGRMADILGKHPFVASLLESLGRGSGDAELPAELRGASAEEFLSARKILSELMMNELGGG
jgi:DNA repair exonuclease SbcCD nuclease subunit